MGYSVSERKDKGFRPNDHLCDAEKLHKHSYKIHIIRKIWSSGEQVEYIVYGQYDTEMEAKAAEIAKINEIGRADLGEGPLANLVDGGNGGRLSSESQEKMAAKVRGRKCSPEHIAKIVKALTGRKNSPETIAKRKANSVGKTANPGPKNGMYGKKHTAEAKLKISANRKPRTISPEEREARIRISKRFYILKYATLYMKIFDMSDEGIPVMKIIKELNISWDVVNRIRPEREYIMRVLEEENAK